MMDLGQRFAKSTSWFNRFQYRKPVSHPCKSQRRQGCRANGSASAGELSPSAALIAGSRQSRRFSWARSDRRMLPSGMPRRARCTCSTARGVGGSGTRQWSLRLRRLPARGSPSFDFLLYPRRRCARKGADCASTMFATSHAGPSSCLQCRRVLVKPAAAMRLFRSASMELDAYGIENQHDRCNRSQGAS
jgi:hypothetical protein